MARYLCSLTLSVPIEELLSSLGDILQTCDFEIIYQTGDYLMAREVPGRISFSKLVTVEALIDRTTATPEEVRVNFVVKNEELPLQVDNHCRQMFNVVQRAIADSSQWQLLESVSS
ncbi:hypothetical protein IQ249_03195 [Lusitaniella coriacea LEGE 07157]|uniref:Uncharacterized protein n=1 Tax=Lusitaniella coriacea LEGE 07157 TaxID=945747 RepID=A0A8J7ARP0_9CYAN|nr:hypothetical protein [Lusitaniella coriacea]MBE9114896.1 hypothetical protein [Lusitaniella coriacea LEGE 07157]